MDHCLKRNGMDNHYKVNKIDYNPLIFDKIYALDTENHIYIGTYSGIIRDNYGCFLCLLSNIIKKDKQRHSLSEKLKGISYFSRQYTFYDVEEIRKNAKNARQSMEKRTLDIILKKVVNENFQWL
jgi:hypothetical protein